MNAHGSRDRLILGALCVVGSALMFSFSGASIKVAAQTLSTDTIVFWRHAVGLVLLSPWAIANRRKWFKVENTGQIATWALATFASLYCYYFAIRAIPLADAALLSFSAPIFVPVLGFLLFQFHLDKKVLAAILLGFVGVAVVLQPGVGVFHFSAIIGLLSGAFGGLAVVLLWRITSAEHPGRLAFYFSVFGLTVSAIPMGLAGEWPSTTAWLALLSLGFCSTMAVFLLSYGCLIASADRVITLDYTGVLFASALGWLFWHEQPNLNLFIGGALIIGAGIFVIRSKPHNKTGSREGTSRIGTTGVSTADDRTLPA